MSVVPTFAKHQQYGRYMSSASFPRIDTTDWPLAEFETSGLDAKYWLLEPTQQSRWLFKPVKRHAASEKSAAWEQGEDWSEKIACEVATLLGVPTARVALAERDGCNGSISLNMVPHRWEIQPGAVVLSGAVPSYNQASPNRTGHSLPNIHHVLSNCLAPLDEEIAQLGAFEAFAGYLVLDAWIGNRDRHDENWAVLRDPVLTDPSHLAPSYDHASSLGFNLQDRKRKQILADDLPRFAARGTAWRFENGRRTTLVELACAALELAGARARRYWLDRLGAVSRPSCEATVDGVPGMSDPARTFVVELLDTNRRRLLDGC